MPSITLAGKGLTKPEDHNGRATLKEWMHQRVPEGRRLLGSPRRRWLDNVVLALQKFKLNSWRMKAHDRQEWMKIASSHVLV